MKSKYRNILVPLDGSGLAELAADHAGELARLAGASLTFVRVCADREGLREAADYLYRVLQQPPFAGLHTDGRVERGHPAEQILRAADRTGADLIVISSHGRTGISRQVFGSVAEEVVRLAHCPVMVVKAPHPDHAEEKAS